jgi:hypothetical protein
MALANDVFVAPLAPFSITHERVRCGYSSKDIGSREFKVVLFVAIRTRTPSRKPPPRPHPRILAI